jgi:hypothetical protein
MSQILLRFALTLAFLTAAVAGPVSAQTRGDADVPAAAPAAAGDEHWDDHFGVPGIYNGSVQAMASAGGSLYVGGGFAAIPGVAGAKGIARWDGRRWHALGAGVNDNAWVRAVAAQGANVYIAGDFTAVGGVSAKGIARWDGAKWSRLGSGQGPRRQYYGWEDGSISAIAVAPNGDVYVAGYFNYIDAVAARGIARWDGTKWNALGEGLYELDSYEGAEPRDANVYALAIGADGSVFAGGNFNRAGAGAASSVARWNGSAWSGLGGGITDDRGQPGQVKSLLFHGGRLYAGGYFQQAGAAAATNIAAWDGAAWAPLGDGLEQQFPGDPVVFALMGDGAGIVAGGKFNTAGGSAIAGLARWDGAAWSPVGAEGKGVGSDYLEVRALAPAPEGGYVAAGTIDKAGGIATTFGLARWIGAEWVGLGAGVAQYGDTPADVRAITTDRDGNVYIGGFVNYAGGAEVRHVAVWDGERWRSLGGVVGDTPSVNALTVIGEDLYAAGRFSQVGGVAARNIARYNIPSGRWSALGAGIDDTVNALAFGDGKLYAGGGFTTAGGGVARDVAVWDGQSWSALGGAFEIYEIFDSGSEAGTYVNALAYADGNLFIGGYFQTVHDKTSPLGKAGRYAPVHNLVRYNVAAQSWNIVGPNVHPGVTTNGYSGFGTYVYALAYVGGALYAGGNFTIAGGIGAANLARYDLATNSWSAIGALGGEELTVRALDVYGPDLFVGGTFTTIGEAPARFVARYNVVNRSWSTLGSGMKWYNDKYTRVTALWATADGVYVGGKFDMAGEQPALGFARWGGPMDPNGPGGQEPGPGDPGNPGNPGGNPGSKNIKVYLPLTRR